MQQLEGASENTLKDLKGTNNYDPFLFSLVHILGQIYKR